MLQIIIKCKNLYISKYFDLSQSRCINITGSGGGN